MSAPITIRDRRHLPFFMVHLDALQAIRDVLGGPPRSRALGLYVLLCHLANEQRATGDRRQLTATYQDLTRRGSVSPTTLKKLLGALDEANVARVEIRVDRMRGSMPSLIRLPIQDGAWAAISVPMAEHLARTPGVQPLPALGLLTTLLEFCEQQRSEHGGQRAEVTRADIGRRVGLSADRVDDRIKALEASGVLRVTRRRVANGPSLPSLYDVMEPAQSVAVIQGRNSDTPLPQIRSTGAAEATDPSRNTEHAARQNEPARAAEATYHGGNSATPGAEAPPFNASAGDAEELHTKKTTLIPPIEAVDEGGGKAGTISPEALCRELLAVLSETRGPGPARRYGAERDAWHAAAARLLADHEPRKLTEAVHYLIADQIVGTKVRGMPDLETHIEDLRHRAYAARQPNTQPALAGEEMTWPAARGHIQRAIQRHGAGEKAAAIAELTGTHSLLGAFVEQVGWRALCQTSMEQQDTTYRVSWMQLTRNQEQGRTAA